MAYTGSSLSLIAASIEGSFNIFSYISPDSIQAVTANNYFSDGVERGMGVGDFLFAVVTGVPYILYVSASSGLACTVESAVLSLINGNSLPTINPGAGSGLIWNNAGFVCVA